LQSIVVSYFDRLLFKQQINSKTPSEVAASPTIGAALTEADIGMRIWQFSGLPSIRDTTCD